ncbi:MAG TPA: DNA polymerase III subunit chi [Steroidobacteraceae bacterium]|jgi:DNA polymerase-3 subunit chi
MDESVATSDSADSSAARRSSPASSAADGSRAGDPGAALRVDFYVLGEASASARLRLGCKLAEKAYLSAQRTLVWLSDPQELKAFDELLWTFMDGSFVPHDVLGSGTAPEETPVLLSAGITPQGSFDIIINLAPGIPGCLSQTGRVAEIVDGEEARRRAGRARFKAYRDLGVQPASHNIRAE